MKIKTKIGQLFQLAIITSSLMGSSAWALSKNSSGVYQITSAQDLKDFATLVNSKSGSLTEGLTGYDAELTDDITWDSSNSNLGNWTPIGSHEIKLFSISLRKAYASTFKGNGHKIYNLTCSSTSDAGDIGLFGYILNATIDGINLVNSNISGVTNVGGICGWNNGGTISNCSNTGTITGSSEDVGGICGHNQSGTILNVYNTSDVSGSAFVGGICGSNESGTIQSCYSTGKVSGTGSNGNVGAVCEYNNNGTMTSCYYLYGKGSDSHSTAMTSDQFASGELAIILQMWVDNNKSSYSNLSLSNWSQDNGTDASPVFGGDRIEYVRANPTNNWGTLCLPYKFSYEGVAFYDVKGVVNNELVLSPADSVTPGKPVVYYYTGADNSLLVTIPSTKFGTVATLTANNSLLNGVYEYSTVSGTTNYYLKNDVFYKSAGSIIANPFRAYIKTPVAASAPRAPKALALSLANNASDDSEEEAATVTESHIVAIYNISGQQVDKMDRGGIYVVKMSDGSTKKVRITE